MTNILAYLIDFISENLLVIQLVSLFTSTVLLGFTIYFLIKINLIGEEVEHYLGVLAGADISKRRTLKAWKQIQKRLRTKKESQLKLAVLEADQILNEILRMAGYQGKNLDECLSQITPAQLSNIEEIKQAHKLRDRIASESDFTIAPNEAEIIVEIYKKAFQELNLIE
jgi:uncharacterized protein YifE (UPF0438 family)